MCGCYTRPTSRQSKITRKSVSKSTEGFWGPGISKYPIDPDTEERIKQKAREEIEWWNSPDYPYEKPKGINVDYLRVVPLSGEIDEYGWCKGIYRVYYGKRLYDECTNDSHLRDINPDKRKNRVCEFCQMPDDHDSCGLSRHKESRFGFDKILDKLRPKCPYS